MKSYLRLCALYLMVLIFSCKTSDPNLVKLLDKSFEDEVPQGTNFVFTFDKDLVGDTLIEVWDTTSYITFNPPIPGRYTWSAANQLTFVPYDLLPPATDFKATLTDKVLGNLEGMDLDMESKEMAFHTPYLQMKSTFGYWKALNEEDRQPYLHFDLRFNYPVDPNDMADLLKLEMDGQAKDFTLTTQRPAEVVTIYLKDKVTEDKEFKATLTVKEGLSPEQSDYTTSEPFVGQSTVASPFKISIQEVKTEHDGGIGKIIIMTSQEVNEKGLEKFIDISPEVKYKITVNEQYLTLSGEGFDVDKFYDVAIREGLKGKLGGSLKNDYTEQVSFAKLRPSIAFVDGKGVYLSRKGAKDVEVEIVNVEEVKLKVIKVYQNNISAFIGSRSYNYNYSYSRGSYGHGYNYYDAYNLGDVVYEEEISSKDLPGEGKIRQLNLDFEDKLKGHEGFYVVELRSDENYWLRAQKVIAISDIGLIAKEGKNSIMVFANSIRTTEPLADVELTFIGQNNQEVKTLRTDANGIATYNIGELPASGFKVNIITAQLGSDFNYMPFTRTMVSTSRFEVGGRHENDAGLEAFIYGERDLYRPGETVNVSCIIRDRDWKVPGKIPVKFKLVAPNGKDFTTLKKVLNEQGSFEASIDIPTSAPTGTYYAYVYTSTDVLLNSYGIAVEEFMPDRIKVEVDLDKEDLKPNDTLNMDITATNFFGPPAAERDYKVVLHYARRGFYSKDHPGYNYSISGDRTYFNSVIMEGKTDENGQTSEQFTIPATYTNMGKMEADFFVTVFDETGRPVNVRRTLDVFTQDYFYGIKYMPYYNKAGMPIEVPLIAVDTKGKAANGVKAQVEVVKYEYRTVLSKAGSYYRYRSEEELKTIKKETITLNGTETTFSFLPELSGRYELRVTKPGEKTHVSEVFYVYGWGRTTNTSFQVNNEGTIDIELDQESYKAGEKAKVLVKAPFSGKLLVTVEGNNVVKHFYTETDNKAASFTLNIDKSYVPNLYVTATLFRPHQASDLPLTVAHGFAPIMVEDPSKELPITIEANELSRSKTKQKIKVKTKPGAKITIAVVDEGILQMTAFKTPDPFDFFYQKRALGVSTYDVYPFLLPELEMRKGKAGGGGELSKLMEDRINPLTNKRVKLVSFWSGIMDVQGNGEATFEIDIPEFSGSLRIMAVSYKGDAFGSNDANIRVADPIVVSSGLPRFLSPGDTVVMPVTISNTTEKNASAKVKVNLEGPLKVVGEAEVVREVLSEKENRVYYTLVVDQNIGEAKVSVLVDALGETFSQNIDITVRPTAPLQKRHGSGMVSTDVQAIEWDVEGFMPASLGKKLVVSRSPLIQFTDDLEYLVQYPHGCVEQTVSSAFPQLYYKDIVSDVLTPNRSKYNPNPDYHVREAINKLMTMQLYNGALTYWPGEGTESWWGSVYAAHFLLEAKKAGFEVDQSMLDYLYGYMKTKLKDKTTFPIYYKGTEKKMIVPRMVPYSIYVLALAGEAPISTMNYYKAHSDLLSIDGKYMLAAAYVLAGDPNKYREILPGTFEAEEAGSATGGSFYSDIRDEALALNVMLEVDPDNPQVGIMARHVSEYLKTRRYLNTQERTFSFLALGKIAKRANASKATAKVMIDGKEVAAFTGKNLTLETEKLQGSKVELDLDGEGELYYYWEVKGISVDGSYKEEDSYLKVRKTFYDQFGRQITSNKVKQMDLVVVKVSITGTTKQYVQNVAITDMLPAGFEIENSRITETQKLNWIKNRNYPQYEDIRDDRITFFTDVSYSTKNFYYMVRAVTKGNYQMGPVGADAMYNGEYHSYSGGGEFKVE